MKKEVLLAILLGFGIGLLIALGVVTARSALKEHSQQPPEAEGAESADQRPSSQNEPGDHSLVITSPGNNDVVADEQLTVVGSTSPGSVLAITTEDENLLVEVDELGQFGQTVELVGGVNLIRVVSFSAQGERQEAEVTVIYTTAEF